MPQKEQTTTNTANHAMPTKAVEQNKPACKDVLEVNFSLLLKFQEKIVVDLVEQDALLVLGRGLGINQIVPNLLHVLMQSTGDDKRSLIMLINATEDENRFIEESLMELAWNYDGNDDDDIKPDDKSHKFNGMDIKHESRFSSILGDAGTVDRRRDLYANGGIVSVSNRVLVTDMLSHVVEPKVITGLVILHAENISQYSMDRFVVNLYRRGNKWGFVKALSDDPEKCCRGFQPLQTKLKYFKLENCFLWPRFHVGVTESIKRKMRGKNVTSLNKVTEVRIKMTDYMTKIQNSLMASIELLIGELRRNNPDVASEYWTIENALDANFIQSIIGTLNPVWHRVSITTKKILSELSTIKNFLLDLFQYDSVSYYQNIRSFVSEHTQSISNKESLWLMIPEASATIACSKDRVYRKLKLTEPGKPTGHSNNNPDNYLLEELPKWEQLMLILDEINDEKLRNDIVDDGPTVIACSSRLTCHQLERVLSKYQLIENDGVKSYSFRKVMTGEFRYQKSRRNRGLLVRKINEELKKVSVENNEVNGIKDDDVVISKTFTKNRFRNTDRRRTRGGSVVAQHNRLMNLRPDEDDINDDATADADVDLDSDFQMDENNLDSLDFNLDDHLIPDLNVGYDLVERGDEIIITTFDSISLEETLPSYIVCYEPDLTFVRRVELYQASLNPAKCFFMYYGESVEEQIYLSSIKHEKDAFTKLIREKANMPKFFSTEDDEKSKFDESFRHLNSNTRIAGGGLTALSTTKVIVDIRDFVSQLPFVCYLAGLEVIPAMLTVGDYILSDEICVERKAVRDLIDSLENGRLMKQCESMFKWYARPVLLIEFEEGKSFSFEPFTTGFLTNNSTKHVKNADLEQLQLRMAALVRSFPRLSILWSSSPFETARLFRELKANQNEPDVEFALTAGMNDTNNGSGFNEDAIKLLRLIPGITDASSLLIIGRVKNLYDFCQMSVADMSEIIGLENAQKAYKFINKQYK